MQVQSSIAVLFIHSKEVLQAVDTSRPHLDTAWCYLLIVAPRQGEAPHLKVALLPAQSKFIKLRTAGIINICCTASVLMSGAPEYCIHICGVHKGWSASLDKRNA